MYHNKESEYAKAHVLPFVRKDVAGEKGSVDISRRCCSYSFVCSLLTAMAMGMGMVIILLAGSQRRSVLKRGDIDVAQIPKRCVCVKCGHKIEGRATRKCFVLL